MTKISKDSICTYFPNFRSFRALFRSSGFNHFSSTEVQERSRSKNHFVCDTWIALHWAQGLSRCGLPIVRLVVMASDKLVRLVSDYKLRRIAWVFVKLALVFWIFLVAVNPFSFCMCMQSKNMKQTWVGKLYNITHIFFSEESCYIKYDALVSILK